MASTRPRDERHVEHSPLAAAMGDRPLPHAFDVEMAALGEVLLSRNWQATRPLAVMMTGAMYFPAHSAMLEEIIAIGDEHDTVSLPLLATSSRLAEFGGNAGMMKVANSGVSHETLPAHVFELRRLAHVRGLITLAWELGDRCYDPTEQDGARAALLSGLHEIDQQFACGRSRSTEESIEAFLLWLEKIRSRDFSCGIPTGITSLDQHGLWRPGYYVIAARSSHGKTALGLSVALGQAMAGVPVMYWSGEQTESVLVAKLVSILTSLRFGQVVEPHKLASEARLRWDSAMATLRRLPMRLLYGHRSLDQICAAATAMQRAEGLGVIYLDQMSKIDHVHRRGMNKEQMLGETSDRIGRMVEQYGIPIVLEVQLNIKAQASAPSYDHVKDCGKIYEDTDVWLTIDNPRNERERLTELLTKKAKLIATNDLQDASEFAYDTHARVTCEKDRNGYFSSKFSQMVRFLANCGAFVDGGANPLKKDDNFV